MILSYRLAYSELTKPLLQADNVVIFGAFYTEFYCRLQLAGYNLLTFLQRYNLS